MSSINAAPGSALEFSALIKSGDSNANLALQANGVTAVQINSNQVANFTSTSAVLLPRGTTAQRPASPANGMLRYNTNYANIEAYVNGIWTNVTPILTPVISIAPVASGNAVVGELLSVTTGTWSNTPTGYYYQWLANAVAISSNATSNTFVLTATQLGSNVSCNVTAYNSYGNSTTTVTSNSIGPVANTYAVSYLVVAGGGGGGTYAGGGGGGGGYLTSTSALNVGTTYTITVGGGGAGGPGSSTGIGSSTSGSNSSIFGTGFTTITSVGGGGTGLYGVGFSGGSGGGASLFTNSGGAATSGQGNNGGNSNPTSGPQLGGGGGGAGSAGGNATTASTGGSGGSGASSSITGSAVTYAGGGGAGVQAGYTPGSGGSGGGAGGNAGGGAASSGSTNTGGGGGGAGNNNSGTFYNGGSGGSGVVILSVPTARYSGVTTGSPTITTSGANTIIKFTSSGTYTA